MLTKTNRHGLPIIETDQPRRRLSEDEKQRALDKRSEAIMKEMADNHLTRRRTKS